MNREIRVVKPKSSVSSSDQTGDEENIDTVEVLKQQVLELKKKLKKNKNSRRSHQSNRPKTRNKPERSLSSYTSSTSIKVTSEGESSDGRKKGERVQAGHLEETGPNPPQ
jgi:hypothetical protein